ncbi:MAG: SBBP repeat-containing protein [Acidobacteria bacterium]|nr:SBBP repeat-containing protein [Acidobacteriota bacterium]
MVAPHASPDQIKFAISTSDSHSLVRVNDVGDLIIRGDDSEILFHKPLLYQGKSCTREKSNIAGEDDCKALQGGGFRLQRTKKSSVIVSFQLPSYDRSQPLIIDPAVSFSTYLGGGFGDGADGMALDGAGNIYLYGDSNSPDFPTTAGAYQRHLSGDVDAFVTKLTPDGSQVLWSTYLGGTGAEFPTKVAVDSEGNVFVTGTTLSSDFPLVNAFQSQLKIQDAFVSKLSPDGSKLVYSTYFGGFSQEYATAIAVDEKGQAVITGTTASLDLPVANAWQLDHAPTDNGPFDGFVTKFSADGTSLVFSTYLGGNTNDQPTAMALDPSDNVYVAGYTGAGFPITPNAFQQVCVLPGVSCSFVSKFTASGQDLAYSTFINDSQAYGLAVNAAGNAYVTGIAGADFPVTPGAFQTVIGNPGIFDPDAFVTELDATGSSPVYSTFLGGNNIDWGWAIALDSSNNAYMTGQTRSTNFPLQSPVQSDISGDPLIFVSELNSTGSALPFSTYWGGSPGFGDQQGNAIAVDSVGDIIVAGFATVPDFPVVNPIQANLNGPGDAVVFKIQFTPDFTVMGSPQSVTVFAGQSATYSLTLTPLNAFNQQISLSCSGAPPGSMCTVSPSSLTLDGANPAPATVTIQTIARSGNAMALSLTSSCQFLTVFALAGLFLADPRVVRVGQRQIAAVLMVLMLALGLLVSCGGGGSTGGGGGGGGGGGTPPGTYAISLKANSGSLNHSAKFTLVVK